MFESKTILCIDDDPTVLAVLKARLADKDGYNVFMANTAKSGTGMALEHEPDVILLDWMLPDASGLRVLEELKGDSRTTWTPIYMLTGRTKMGDVERALDKGAAGYFTKPIKIKEISDQLSQLKKPKPAGILNLFNLGV